MRLCRKAAVLVTLFTSQASWGQGDALQRGLELFRKREYAAALQQFEEARQRDPANASIDNFIGITETRLGRMDEADQAYQMASRIDPKLAGPHTNLGFNFLSAKQYGPAEEQLRTAVRLDDTDPFSHYYLAVLYLTTSREKEAVPQIEPAISLLKDDLPAAVLAIKAGLRFDAHAESLKLLELVDARLSGEQEYELATLLTEQGQYPAAAARFRRIAEMQPSWQNQYNLAVALVRAKETAQALPLLAALTAEHGSDAKVLSGIASVYESAGDSSLALDAWHKAIAAEPNNPDLYLDCTRLLIDMDRYQEASEIVQRGVSLVPDDYPLTMRLGAIAMMSGDHEKAREIYRKAIAEHPMLALGYVALGQSYMKEGKDDEALKVLTNARSVVPRDFALEYAYGLVSFQLGQQEQALQALSNAEQMEPEVVEPHYQLGLLHMKAQAWKAASDEFEQVIKLDPQNAATYYQLSRTYQRLGQSEKAQEMAKQASELTKSQREEAIKSQQLRFGIPSRD